MVVYRHQPARAGTEHSLRPFSACRQRATGARPWPPGLRRTCSLTGVLAPSPRAQRIMPGFRWVGASLGIWHMLRFGAPGGASPGAPWTKA